MSRSKQYTTQAEGDQLPIHRQSLITRRTALAGALAPFLPMGLRSVASQVSQKPQAVDIGNGLEIRDYRLFPTEDEMRFIVEIHNTSDTAIDTPAVGVTLPHLESKKTFWLANPVATILHPHQSGCLVGNEITGISTDNDWGDPEWVLCDRATSSIAKLISNWQIEISHRVELMGPQVAKVNFDVVNISNSDISSWFYIDTLIWDANERICGLLQPVAFNGAKSGEHIHSARNLWSGMQHPIHPLTLLDNVEGILAEPSVQIRLPGINPPCPAIMPWNQ